MTILVAACTNVMNRAAALHGRLYAIGSDARTSNLNKFVVLLLCIPCFKASNLCFEIAYFLNQRHLRRLGFENALLDQYYRAVAGGRVVNVKQALRHVEEIGENLVAEARDRIERSTMGGRDA